MSVMTQKRAASLILTELSKINRKGLGRLSDSYEKMKGSCCGKGYKILRDSKIPAVLVEVGYLTNRTEDKLLNSQDYQEKAASAMSSGIIKYLLANGWEITKTSN